MATSKAEARKAIANRLNGFTRFHPIDTNIFGGLTTEPGDLITVENEGTSYDVPVFTLDLDWKGDTTVEVKSTGSKKRPDPAKLSRGGYGGNRKKEEEELLLVRHQSDIEKSDERITLWATEEEWSAIKQEYQTIRKSQFELTAEGISSVVTGIDAGNFDPTHAYAVGDVCVRNGKVYVFTTAHIGPWNAEHATEAINLYGSVKSHSTRITQTENSIGLVVENGSIRAGQIMLAINGGTGHSEAYIEADKVLISGDTTLNGTMEIDNGLLWVKKSMTIGSSGGNTVAINNGKVTADEVDIRSSGSFKFVNASGNPYYEMTSAIVGSMIKTATVANNTLTLTRFDGTYETFSKAIAPTITGDWNGGVLHVSTSPSAVADLYYYLSQQSETWNDTTVSIPIGYATGQHDPVAGTAYTASLNVNGKLYAGSYSSNGFKTPPSGYIGFSSVDINVPSGSHSISASVQSGTFATRQDMEEEYPGHSWSSIGSVSTGYRAVKITCGSATKWVFYVGT